MKTTHWLIACFVLAVFLLPRYAPAEDAADEAELWRLVSVTEHPRFGKIILESRTITAEEVLDWIVTIYGDDLVDVKAGEEELREELELSQKMVDEIGQFVRSQLLNAEKLEGYTRDDFTMRPLDDAARKYLAERIVLEKSQIGNANFVLEFGIGCIPHLTLHNDAFSIMLLPDEREKNGPVMFILQVKDQDFIGDEQYAGQKLLVNGRFGPEFNEVFTRMLARRAEEPEVPRQQTAAEIFAKVPRKEGLEFIRRLLADDDILRVLDGLRLLENMEAPLTDEDVARLLTMLEDKRGYAHDVPASESYHRAWRRPLAARVLDVLVAKGLADRAMPVVTEHLVWPDALAAYDEAKLMRFLAALNNPELTKKAFWQLADDSGFRLEETRGELPSDWDAYAYDEEEEEDEMKMPEMKIFNGMSVQVDDDGRLLDPPDEFYRPWNETQLRDYFTWSPQLAELARQAAPDDPRWRFLLVQACFENRTNPETGKSQKLIRNYIHCLAGQNALRPLLDFIRDCPEIVVMDEACRNPLAVGWLCEDEDLIACDAVMAALACDLTPDERLQYAAIGMEIFARMYEKTWKTATARLADSYGRRALIPQQEIRHMPPDETWKKRLLAFKDALEKHTARKP